jgi:hypothetical protein
MAKQNNDTLFSLMDFVTHAFAPDVPQDIFERIPGHVAAMTLPRF